MALWWSVTWCLWIFGWSKINIVFLYNWTRFLCLDEYLSMQEFIWKCVQGYDLIVSHWCLHKDKNRCAKNLSLLSHINTNCLPVTSGYNCQFSSLQLLFSFNCDFYHPIIPACIRWQVWNHKYCFFFFLLILLLDFRNHTWKKSGLYCDKNILVL